PLRTPSVILTGLRATLPVPSTPLGHRGITSPADVPLRSKGVEPFENSIEAEANVFPADAGPAVVVVRQTVCPALEGGPRSSWCHAKSLGCGGVWLLRGSVSGSPGARVMGGSSGQSVSVRKSRPALVPVPTMAPTKTPGMPPTAPPAADPAIRPPLPEAIALAGCRGPTVGWFGC